MQACRLCLSSGAFVTLNPNLDGYKRCVAVRLGVIYDSQTTNRKLGGLPARTPTPCSALLLVAWESYITLRRPIGSWEDSLQEPSHPLAHSCWSPGSHTASIHKYATRNRGSSYFLVEKSPKQHVFVKKNIEQYIFIYNLFTESTDIHCRYEVPMEEPREAHGYLALGYVS